MTEEQIRIRARLAILEYISAHLLLAIYRIRALPPEAVSALNATLRTRLRDQAFPDLDPAMSDLWAAELETAGNRILDAVESWSADESQRSQKPQ